MIEIQRLAKRYKKLIAVDDLTMSIRAGEIFGFIGPNGAGKTTTIRMIGTLLEPDAGTVAVAGFDTRADPIEVRKVVGYMPDFFGLYDDMLVWEYLDFFGSAYDIPPRRRRRLIGETLELVNLAHKRDTAVSGLSRGMKQSLCLAKTLVHDPAVLLLDEPASGLDPRARIEFRELMKELRRMGKTVLISSHILTELSDFCTSIGIIERGRLVVAGPVDEVMKRLQARAEYRIRLREEPNEAVTAVAQLACVEAVTCEDGALEVAIRADTADAAEVVAVLVHRGFHVTECQLRRSNLEEIFMHLTKGVVG